MIHDAATHSGPAARCPLCKGAADPRALARHGHLERRVVDRLQQEHDGWKRGDGACIACVQWASREVARAEASGDLKRAAYGRGGDVLALSSRMRTDFAATGKGVTVAVIDSDFVYHPDLTRPRSRIVTYVDASGATARAGTTPPEPYLWSWHGTMVAGAAFGSGWVAGGRYPGLATKSQLVLVRVARGESPPDEEQVVRGLRWVVAHHERYNIRVVNMSVGGDAPMESRRNRLDRLAARAVKHGLVVVAAAGNRPDRKPIAPASAPEVITVGGVNDFGRADDGETILFPATTGPTLDGEQKPDVLAPSIWVPAPMVPGTRQSREAELLFDLEGLPDALLLRLLERRIAELSLPPEVLEWPPEQVRGALALQRAKEKYLTPWHQHVDGTSFAASIVSAVAAQMLEVHPGLGPEDVKGILKATAVPLAGVPREKQGAGVVQPEAAVAAARAFAENKHLTARAAAEEKHHHRRAGLSPQFDGDVVRYRFLDPSRKLTSVEWFGILAGWKAVPMRKTAPGVFELERPLPLPGRYAYKYLLSDGRWWDDPLNPTREADGYGAWNSVLDVPARRARAAD